MLTSHHRNKSLRRAEDLNFYDIFITFIAFVKERILFSLTALNINSKTSGNRQILATKIDREHPHLPLCKPESHTFVQKVNDEEAKECKKCHDWHDTEHLLSQNTIDEIEKEASE